MIRHLPREFDFMTPLTSLGPPGVIIGALSMISFGFSLVVLIDERDHPSETDRAAFHQLFEGWVRSDDYLGYTLVDRVDRYRASSPATRAGERRLLQKALDDLGEALSRDDARFRLVRVDRLDLGSSGRPPDASWQADPAFARPAQDRFARVDRVEIAAGRGSDEAAVDLVVSYHVVPELAESIQGIEVSYHRLVLALLGLSGYSLLCLGYMARHAQTQRARIAREAAAAATLDLADQTCHELGNVAFVVANERRNLAGHIELLERFVAEDGAALAAAARRAGIDPPTAERFARALRREYADRGIDPEFELKGSAAIARDVCSRIATCSDYIALTVRDLDGHLRRSSLLTEPTSCPLDEVIEESIRLLAPRIEAAQAHVEFPDPATSRGVSVRADRRLLIHAVVNLIKNGVEATAPGPTAMIRLGVDVIGPTAWLAVSDAGPGMTPAKLRRIFEPGYSTKAGGRGLGLAIARESIVAQGGLLEVSSQAGTGTTFRIGLPVEATVRTS